MPDIQLSWNEESGVRGDRPLIYESELFTLMGIPERWWLDIMIELEDKEGPLTFEGLDSLNEDDSCLLTHHDSLIVTQEVHPSSLPAVKEWWKEHYGITS